MKKLFSLHLIFFLFVSCSNEKKDKKSLATFAALSNFFSDTTDKSSSKKATLPPITKLNIKDTLYKDQWYLKNTGQLGGTAGIDINVEPVWKQGYTGKGTHIAILDEPVGLTESTAHEDLKANQNFSQSHNYFTYNGNEDHHGLGVAGIIAASANDLGVRGIAYESKLYTYGVLSDGPLLMPNVVDAMERINRNSQISAVNNSWGSKYILIDPAYRRVLEKGLQTGFSGKGIAHVRAAGNDGEVINSTSEGENNYYGFILVNSVDYNGSNTTKWVRKPKHSMGIALLTSVGANLWVSAPGYELMTPVDFNFGRKKYHYFSATSSASPVVTGIVALMRQANPNLTWRDVKLILAETTIKNDASHSGWQRGHAKKSDPTQSFYFNHRYGFGMVKADKSVALAKTWSNLPTMKTKTFSSGTLDLTIDANVKENTITVQNSGIDFIESVVVELEVEKKANIESSENFDLKLEHNGIVSHLYMEDQAFRFKGSYSGFVDPSYNQTQMTFKMLTSAHLGGNANGTWKIKIKDTEVFTKLKNWKLIIRGH